MECIWAMNVIATKGNNVLLHIKSAKEVSLFILQSQQSLEVGNFSKIMVELETDVVDILSLDVQSILEFLLVVGVVNEFGLNQELIS